MIVGRKKINDKKWTGAYYEPIISDVDSTMKVCNEEMFGSIAPLISFANEESVVKMVKKI